MELEIHCVPGYIVVKGNGQANKDAEDTGKGPRARRCTEQFTSVAHDNQTITERKWKEAKTLVQDKVRDETTHTAGMVKPQPRHQESKKDGRARENLLGADVLPAEFGTIHNSHLHSKD